MLRLIAGALGCCLLIVLAAAVKQDPHLWVQLGAQLDHLLRSHGSQLGQQASRIVSPAGATP